MRMSPGPLYRHILRHDFGAFAHRAFLELNPQTRFEPNWLLEVLAAKLDDVRWGRCRRLMINIPPRHLKSYMASVAFPAWLLGHDPAKQILAISYGQELSEKLARDCRALMMSDFYKGVFETRISADRKAVAEFETTEGGYRLSTSVGGVVTGRGADLVIVDDPMKADDALSDTRRQGVNTWYDNTLRSRLNRQDEGAIIVVMQRLHADDLVAHLQETERWDVVLFPLIAESEEHYELATPYGRRRIHRRADEILHPALLSVSAVEGLRRSMTEYNFAAQYQQDPQPPAGLIVRREWLKFYRPNESPKEFEQIVQSWDTANKTTELSDYSVCTTWGFDGQRLYLLDVFRRKMEFPELKRTVRELAGRWKATVVLIEDKSSGTQLIQELRASNFSLAQAAPPGDGDKVMRLHAQTAKIEGGFALFPLSAPWLDGYLLELTTFPNSKNDDQVDSTVNALAWSTQEAGTGANAWIKYYADLISQARGEKDQRAHLSSAQAESNNSAAEAYDRIVSRANKRNERLCAWCGEEVGKSYATDGVYVYHQEPNKDCYALNMKAGIKCPRHCAWCGEEVGEAYGSDGCHVYHKEPDRDCYALMVKASRKRSGGRPAGGGYFFG
jgi:predicted phage terminase large subunit-like protein